MPEEFSAAQQHHDPRQIAHREKSRAALLSVLAAVVLTTLKLVVGALTGSLGILAEALHSALDLVAAALTFAAVRLAGQPPDPEHRYGHGRVENLSAFVESILLLITAGWVIYEAIHRLFFTEIHVEPTIWAFLVMGVSIAIDIGRSRNLARMAHQYNSQALAADAMHFRTDIWSSSVVILGLGLIALGQWRGISLGGWLPRIDALAALAVSGIVLFVTGQLLRESVDVLLDRAPGETADQIVTAAEAVPGVINCRRVRLRRSGGMVFADVVIEVARTATFGEAHAISEAVEEAISSTLGWDQADIVVHIEPVVAPEETPSEAISFLARQHQMRAHDVRMRQINGRLDADLHVEVDPSLTLQAAHALTTRLEQTVRAANPLYGRINTHLEAPEVDAMRQIDVTTQRAELVAEVRDIADSVAGSGSCHEVKIYRPASEENTIALVLHCSFPGSLTVAQVHLQSEAIERQLYNALPGLRGLLIHAEPAEE